MRNGNRKYEDPWGKRQHPYRYDPDILHAMLLDDYERFRPLWGPGLRGTEHLVFACEKVAAHRKVHVDTYFDALMAEGAARTSRTSTALA